MNPISQIAYRTVVTPFYKQIAGVLYFLFFLLFGIQEGLKQLLEAHYYIIVSIIENKNAFLFYVFICFIYFIKCVVFYANRVPKAEYEFLQMLNSISLLRRLVVFAFTGFMLLLPVTIYTVCIIGTAVFTQRATEIFPHLSFLFFLFMAVPFCFNYFNRNTVPLFSNIGFRFRKQPATIWWFLLKYMFREQFFALFLIKLISFFCIYLFVITDESVFESRMLWLIFMLCLTAHSVIIYKNFYFLENKLAFYKSLPMKPIAVLASLFFCYVILLIPEYWALRALALQHSNLYEYICILIAAPAFLTLLQVLLYTEFMKMENYLTLVMLVWMVFFFMGFTKTKWLVPATAIVGATIVFYTSFKGFEKVSDKEQLE